MPNTAAADAPAGSWALSERPSSPSAGSPGAIRGPIEAGGERAGGLAIILRVAEQPTAKSSAGVCLALGEQERDPCLDGELNLVANRARCPVAVTASL